MMKHWLKKKKTHTESRYEKKKNKQTNKRKQNIPVEELNPGPLDTKGNLD